MLSTAKRDSNDEDGSYTPRSPTAGLPEADSFYPTQSLAALNPRSPLPPELRQGTELQTTSCSA